MYHFDLISYETVIETISNLPINQPAFPRRIAKWPKLEDKI